MLDAPATVTATLTPGLPVDKLVLGKPAGEVAALLPRVFNLCRAAQGAAAALALGQEMPSEDRRGEILRDHLMKLCISFPGHLDLAPLPLPEGWQIGGAALVRALTGHEHIANASGFERLLSDTPVGAVLRAIEARFAPNEAATDVLDAPSDTALFAPIPLPLENSVAGRQAEHPAMRAIETTYGRGPFWRASARLFDLIDAAHDRLPRPRLAAPGRAVVMAARGTYAVAADLDGMDNIATFQRITPTDHLMAPGGIMQQTFTRLAPKNHSAAKLILDILDPCSPVELKEASHA